MARTCVIQWSIKILNKNNLWYMVLASSTNLIKYTKIRQVGFNTDQNHSWLVRLLIQMLWSSAIVLLLALYWILSDKIKCATFRLSCECNKIWEWSECGGKARYKKWIEKKSFWPPWHAWYLNAQCGCDRSFLYTYFTLVQAFIAVEG